MEHVVRVIVPVLGRPERAWPVFESVMASRREASLAVTFVCTASDTATLLAVRETGADVLQLPERQPGDYARKINAAYRRTSEEFVFLGADDLVFHEGWADTALAAMEAGRWGVVGTNDMANPGVMRGKHATHSLVRRAYADWCGTIDERKTILHEGYHHNWVDNEFCQTAISRRVFGFCADSVVEHLHPVWGTAPNDDTYKLGQEGYRADAALFNLRKRLWE